MIIDNCRTVVFYLLLQLSVISNVAECTSSSISDKMIVRVNEFKELLPSSMEFTNQTINTTLADVLFHQNQTLNDQFHSLISQQLDPNGDGYLNQSEIRSAIIEKMGGGPNDGGFRMFMARLIPAWMVDKYVESKFGLNATTNISMANLIQSFDKALNLTVVMPADYLKICDYVSDVTTACVGGAAGVSEYMIQAMNQQRTICKSGFSWLLQNADVEYCIVKSLSTSSSNSGGGNNCDVKQVKKCLESSPNLSQSPLGMHSALSPSSSVSLQKRSFVLNGAPVASGKFMGSLLAFFADTAMLGLVIFLFVAIVLGSLYLSIVISSAHNVNKYWLGITDAEHWKIGNEYPPCGTKIVFWSDKCGAIGSSTARTCSEGQPLYRQACGSWWSYGSRKCRFLGCQPICFNVSRRNCPSYQNFTIGYDQGGRSIVVPSR